MGDLHLETLLAENVLLFKVDETHLAQMADAISRNFQLLER